MCLWCNKPDATNTLMYIKLQYLPQACAEATDGCVQPVV